jgi:hypothetical protein
MNADVPAQTSTRRDDLSEWFPFIGVVTAALAVISLFVALLVFVSGHFHSITGLAFAVLEWAYTTLLWVGIAAAIVALAAVVGKLASQLHKHIKKNSTTVPGLFAAITAAFLGFANDLVEGTLERVFVACVLGAFAFFAVELFRDNKWLGSVLLLALPVSLVGLFFLMPSGKQQKWLHDESSTGLVFGVLTVIVIALALVMAWAFDRSKKAAADE